MTRRAYRLLCAGLPLGVTLLLYLLCAYVANDLNPTAWPPYGRFFHAGVTTVALCYVMAILGDVYVEPSK